MIKTDYATKADLAETKNSIIVWVVSAFVVTEPAPDLAKMVQAQLSLQLAKAHHRIERYEQPHGNTDVLFNPEKPEHAGAIAFSATAYASHLAA